MDKYEQRIIDLFKSGRATEEQWKEMAGAVLNQSEEYGSTDAIDAAIFPCLAGDWDTVIEITVKEPAEPPRDSSFQENVDKGVNGIGIE